MRRAYLYNQPSQDADHMNADPPPFIDMPNTSKAALGDLVDRGGLVEGDTLVVTALSKLGQGQGGVRIQNRLKAMGVTVEVSPSPYKEKSKRKKRAPDAAQLVYLKGVWSSSLDRDAALLQATRHMGFEVDYQWMNYHVCMRDGSASTKVKRKQKEPSRWT